MFIIKFIRFFRGYLRISFSGENSERMLTICAANRLLLWDILKDKNDIIASISVRDFLKLRYVKRKSKVQILSKCGFPFYIRRYDKRFGFAVGILIFTFLMVFLPDRIWIIKVSGNQTIETKTIVSALEELDIKTGCCRRKIDSLNGAVELANMVEGIAWAALNVEGTTLTVDVTETIKEEMQNDTEPQNLIAISDGIITKVELIGGFSRVKPGDSVAKGDILADGFAEIKDGTQIISSAKGKIIAKTQRILKHIVPFECDETIFNGEEKTKSVLEFFGIRMPLYLGSEKKTAFTKFSGGYLSVRGKPIPIAIYTKRFYYTDKIRIRLSKQEAVLTARGKLNSAAGSIQAKNWVLKSEDVRVSDDVLIVTWTIVCEENIAIGEKMNFDTLN